MLIEDITSGNIPKNVEVLLSSLDQPNINDHMVVLLYSLMIETGFIPADAQHSDGASKCYGFSAQKLNTYNKLPEGWKNSSGNSYEIRFQIAPCTGHRCQLLILSMQDLLVVDLFIERELGPDDNTFVSCFTMTVCSSMHITILESVPGVHSVEYENIRELAHKFKDTVASPARASILTNCGVTNPSLMGLPEEVTLKILQYLNVDDIGKASQACKFMNELSKDQHLWHQLVNRDWKSNKPWSNDVNWSVLYQQNYRREEANRRHDDARPPRFWSSAGDDSWDRFVPSLYRNHPLCPRNELLNDPLFPAYEARCDNSLNIYMLRKRSRMPLFNQRKRKYE